MSRGRQVLIPGMRPASDAIDGAAARSYLVRCARTIERHRALLTRLDRAIGDGDHGDNLSHGFRAVLEEAAAADPIEPRSAGAILRAAGHSLVAAVGGASGPLYGTAFLEAGFACGDSALDADTIGRMLAAAAEGLARRGRCAIGDKTIFDALAPAADSYRVQRAGGATLDEALASAILAARRGMLATVPMVARRGLALRLGDRSRGHLDPGAVSCFLLLRALVPSAADRPA
ncbi:MAG TPA: dihydroxyacetone kinase subunit DhaL [Candidatus Limnocylindria bacterium]|nr:dihydroxyacetone kinase subunit DhaL [Candidatus Limnocylindria bacterium]